MFKVPLNELLKLWEIPELVHHPIELHPDQYPYVRSFDDHL